MWPEGKEGQCRNIHSTNHAEPCSNTENTVCEKQQKTKRVTQVIWIVLSISQAAIFNFDPPHTLSDDTLSVNDAHITDKTKVQIHLAALEIMANLADSMEQITSYRLMDEVMPALCGKAHSRGKT